MDIKKDNGKTRTLQIPSIRDRVAQGALKLINVWIEQHNDDGIDIEALAEDVNLFHQIKQSRDDRKSDRIYDHLTGLEYLREKIEEFERGQNV
ncbi:MAG: hypothetical protein WA125_09980 [Desulfosporosinus sp.]